MTYREATGASQSPLFKWWVAAAVIFGAITMDFGGNVLNVAIPKMMTSFGVSLEKIQWVLTGYVVARTVLMPTVGWLGGWIGQRNLYLCSLLFVVGSSVLGGAAWNLESLIIFRVLQGIGAGPLQAIGLVILFEQFPPHQRGLAVGLVFIGYSLGAAIAYLLGGYLIEHYSWRAMFYLAAPPGVLSLVMAVWILPNDRGQRSGRIDYWGLLFMSLCLSTVLLALTQGRRHGWDSFYIRTLFAIAGPSFLVFILIEMYTRAPVIHLTLYRNVAFTMASLASCLNSMSIHSMQFLTALFLQQILGLDALQSGLIILPSMLLSGVMGPVGGTLSDKMNPRIPVLAGFAGMAGLFYAMSYANAVHDRPDHDADHDRHARGIKSDPYPPDSHGDGGAAPQRSPGGHRARGRGAWHRRRLRCGLDGCHPGAATCAALRSPRRGTSEHFDRCHPGAGRSARGLRAGGGGWSDAWMRRRDPGSILRSSVRRRSVPFKICCCSSPYCRLSPSFPRC